MLNGITTQCGDLSLVDSSKFGEYPIVFAQYDADKKSEYKGVQLCSVPTLDKKGMAAVTASIIVRKRNTYKEEK